MHNQVGKQEAMFLVDQNKIEIVYKKVKIHIREDFYKMQGVFLGASSPELAKFGERDILEGVASGSLVEIWSRNKPNS